MTSASVISEVHRLTSICFYNIKRIDSLEQRENYLTKNIFLRYSYLSWFQAVVAVTTCGYISSKQGDRRVAVRHLMLLTVLILHVTPLLSWATDPGVSARVGQLLCLPQIWLGKSVQILRRDAGEAGPDAANSEFCGYQYRRSSWLIESFDQIEFTDIHESAVISPSLIVI